MSYYRPIYYLGGKSRFILPIKEAIDEVNPKGGRLVDLFSGTGTIAAALGASREVTCVDTQEYSRVLCSAALDPLHLSPAEIKYTINQIANQVFASDVFWCMNPLIEYEQECIKKAIAGNPSTLVELLESPPIIKYDINCANYLSIKLGNATQQTIDRLKSTNLWKSPDTTVSRYFGGVYFSYKQAVMLDSILTMASTCDPHKQDTLKSAAIGTASIIVNTVGKQFAQPIKPKTKTGDIKQNLVKVVSRDRFIDALETYQSWLERYASLPKGIGKPKALCLDYLDALNEYSSTFKVAYADPPYTRDHYSRFYHVLETMCLRDNPEISTIKKNGELNFSRGAYRKIRYQSPFCIRSAAPFAFESLFRTTKENNLPLVLSYSPFEIGDGTHPRVVSMDQIIALAKLHYHRVEICAIEGASHNKLNRRDLKLNSRKHSEMIIKCFL